jgi:hypothetical protein
MLIGGMGHYPLPKSYLGRVMQFPDIREDALLKVARLAYSAKNRVEWSNLN